MTTKGEQYKENAPAETEALPEWVASSMSLREFQEKCPKFSIMALERLTRSTPIPLA